MNQLKVYLLGAGPGDPELITVKGKKILGKADSILYDNLAPIELLDDAKKGCKKIFVGKKSGLKLTSQDEINRILLVEVERLKKKKAAVIVRLKGGDPFVFGRASEEINILEKKKITYEVIPGISSYHAALISAGIPFTDRYLSSSFAVMTGHYKEGHDGKAIQVVPGDTRVYMMAVKNLQAIVKANLNSGLDGQTPACLIENATKAQERIICGALKDIGTLAKKAKIVAPAVLVIGEVVKKIGKK